MKFFLRIAPMSKISGKSPETVIYDKTKSYGSISLTIPTGLRYPTMNTTHTPLPTRRERPAFPYGTWPCTFVGVPPPPRVFFARTFRSPLAAVSTPPGVFDFPPPNRRQGMQEVAFRSPPDNFPLHRQERYSTQQTDGCQRKKWFNNFKELLTKSFKQYERILNRLKFKWI